MVISCCSKTRLIQPSANSKTAVSSYRRSTTICSTRTPRVMYIHFVGRGDEVEMAKGIREALAVTKTPLYPIASGPEAKPDLAKEIEGIIGYPGSMGGGVFHINVPRNDIHVAAMGAAIPSYMGMNTPLNFQLDGSNAAINGDFILRPAEVNAVIK